MARWVVGDVGCQWQWITWYSLYHLSLFFGYLIILSFLASYQHSNDNMTTWDDRWHMVIFKYCQLLLFFLLKILLLFLASYHHFNNNNVMTWDDDGKGQHCFFHGKLLIEDAMILLSYGQREFLGVLWQKWWRTACGMFFISFVALFPPTKSCVIVFSFPLRWHGELSVMWDVNDNG